MYDVDICYIRRCISTSERLKMKELYIDKRKVVHQYKDGVAECSEYET